MRATYTKLKSGEWGIRVEGKVSEGDVITVTKKDGATKSETVEKVVWTGNGITLCAIRQRDNSRSGGGLRGKWTGCACGSIEGYPRDSDCFTCRHDY